MTHETRWNLQQFSRFDFGSGLRDDCQTALSRSMFHHTAASPDIKMAETGAAESTTASGASPKRKRLKDKAAKRQCDLRSTMSVVFDLHGRAIREMQEVHARLVSESLTEMQKFQGALGSSGKEPAFKSPPIDVVDVREYPSDSKDERTLTTDIAEHFDSYSLVKSDSQKQRSNPFAGQAIRRTNLAPGSSSLEFARPVPADMQETLEKIQHVQAQLRRTVKKDPAWWMMGVFSQESARSFHHVAADLFQDTIRWKMKALVKSKSFELVTAFVIVASGVFIGVETELGKNDANYSAPAWLFISGTACNVYFLLETLIRLYAHGREFFVSRDAPWNMFDSLLILLAITEAVMSSINLSALRVLKMLRMIRVFRVFRLSKRLTSLAFMIFGSLQTLFWTMVMLFLIIYALSIFLTTACASWLNVQQSADSKDVEFIRTSFGSIFRTWHTLVKVVLGGMDWGEATTALMEFDMLSGAMLLFYICFTTIAVLNVVTGVFMSRAMESAKANHAYVVEQQMALKQIGYQQIRDFFNTIDVDRSGLISCEELTEMLRDPSIHAFFEVLGFDRMDPQRLFEILDTDQSGRVTFTEFLEGCELLKGDARAIDLHEVRALASRMANQLDILCSAHKLNQ
eukprot:TRINITY_DN103784_c0_g1_i1.p1 TRINITY_DN103784_c0_g1~~TRINITY_DN103784_c0_g1_i1.p1  ORF type:complete len:629 (-),score=75.53 TRINITY_DN103784_c0_g1_i1:188-2074(-)